MPKNNHPQTAVVIPFHDPDGMMFPHLVKITPILKSTFGVAYLSIPSTTLANFPEHVSWLKDDDFFQLIFIQDGAAVGKHFKELFQFAAHTTAPQTVLHLCFIDRLAFAMQTEYRDQFILDMTSLPQDTLPCIFQRSPKAWTTHPRNYYEVEKFITTIGELTLQKSLDFAWCHLVITASHLAAILPSIQGDNLNMMAEIVLQIQDEITSQDVDWLAWEDPFLLSRNESELKSEREQDVRETHKRLSYALPMIQKILDFRK